MKLKKISLRLRIFVAMLFVVVLASILIVGVAIYQYGEEAIDYHQQRLERKEKNIKSHINFVIKQTSYEVKSEKIPYIFKEKIYEIANIHNLQINIYDLDGSILTSSRAGFSQDSSVHCINTDILNTLSNTAKHTFVEKRSENNIIYQSSYSYITDQKFKPLAILNLPYLEDDDFLAKELDEFLERISYAYLFMLCLAAAIAFFLANYITKSIKTISDKINTTTLEKRNARIDVEDASVEISTLVRSYNSMIDQLEDSAHKLAKSEREQAWREMAKQVAHEIKNPLTPMRLSVQNFQRKFSPDDPEIHHKVEEYSETLIQQIDTMSSIASAFSNFANMPAQQNETINVVNTVRLSLDIFNKDYIVFLAEREEVITTFDKTQLIRIVTNLVKNAIQAIPENRIPKIVVHVSLQDEVVKITVSDNGIGIEEKNETKVFEPKFTTKSSGTGLGLAMVKNIVESYNGNITFMTQLDKGTTFIVTFPKT
ncbi:ATP-binding protein [Formosa algae]|uniref:histidine kinase n=1 Tax=Formosa algae TaxID=225843 RepID=A0A9X0YHS9_9FLAO|nr:ATP-binding protein [Formosa algae]MBP1838510.1 signal transduction histidine kinase [Formosa algae]MDQ0335010.1 signal transduction histidine kinase [Formosa algae]OEI79648.1 two-component sensor histidine kinase [Formosa algae]